MASTGYPSATDGGWRAKVPDITPSFWAVQMLATAAGETVADLLTGTLDLDALSAATIAGGLLAIMLVVQIRLAGHAPGVYWSAVVLLAVMGTLASDTLSVDLGMPPARVTLATAGALTVVLSTWYVSERTVSARSVTTRRREGFYWLTLLVSFALGTAVSDLLAHQLGLGYGRCVLVLAGCLLADATAWFVGGVFRSTRRQADEVDRGGGEGVFQLDLLKAGGAGVADAGDGDGLADGAFDAGAGAGAVGLSPRIGGGCAWARPPVTMDIGPVLHRRRRHRQDVRPVHPRRTARLSRRGRGPRDRSVHPRAGARTRRADRRRLRPENPG